MNLFKVQYIISRLLPILGAACLLGSCIREDRSDCLYPLRLVFTYTYNTEGEDLFKAEVPSLHLYLYDLASGQIAGQLNPDLSTLRNGNSLEWGVPPGSYSLVSLGGLGNHYTATATDNVKAAKFGVGSTTQRTIVHSDEHVFHVLLKNIQIDGSYTDERIVDLRKISNDVLVSINGLDEQTRRRLKCTITSSNGSVFFNGKDDDSHKAQYQPNVAHKAGKAEFDFSVMRLAEGDDTKLIIELLPDATGTAYSGIVYNGSLTDLLMEKPGRNLELEDTFHIEIDALELGAKTILKIKVDGWNVVDQGGSIG